MVSRNGKSHSFRTNCQIVLLKSEGRISKEIASFLGTTEQKANRWLWRYKQTGIEGLSIRKGRGRTAILQAAESESVKAAAGGGIGSASAKLKLSWKNLCKKNFRKKRWKGF